MANHLVQTRINGAIKEEAAAALSAIGLTVSGAVRLFLTKVAKEKQLPFEMHVPNTLTLETMAKSERGEDVFHAKDVDDLFKQLGI